jgi:hypothetical protein
MMEQYPNQDDMPSVEEVDNQLVKVREAEIKYNEAKALSSEANAVFVEAKEKLTGMLKRLGKDRWESPHPDYSGYSMYDELRFRVPQGVQDNRDFLNFLKSDKVAEMLQQDPADIYFSFVSVHSGKLNKLCKDLTKMAADKGENLDIPGIMEPTYETKIRSLPKRKKK